MDVKMLDLAIRYQGFLAALAGGLALWVWPEGAGGVLSGALLMAGNFWFFKTLMERITQEGSGRKKAVYAFLVGIKMFVVMGLLSFLIAVVGVNPIGLSGGMITFFIGIGLGWWHTTLSRSSTHNEPLSNGQT